MEPQKQGTPYFRLLAKEQDFIVIDKAAGVNFHRVDNIPGITEIIKTELNLDTLLPVHRLDKVTSGLMVFARNREAASDIAEQFRNRTVKKFYLAVSDRKPVKKQGTIKGDMKRGRRGSWMLTREQNSPAVTRFISRGTDSGYRLFLVKPVTGKTHQIRVALKSIGAPICGDTLYYPAPVSRSVCMLHSFALGFTYKDIEFFFNSLPQWDIMDTPSVSAAVDEFSSPLNLF